MIQWSYCLPVFLGVQECGDEATTSLYDGLTTEAEYVNDQNHCNEKKEAV